MSGAPTSTTMTTDDAAKIFGMGADRSTSLWRVPVKFARQKPLGAFGAAVVLSLLIVAVFGDLIAPSQYDDISNLSSRVTGPSLEHPFGIDDQGRDVLSRVIYGANTSVLIGFGTVLIAGIASSVIGTTSGYYGGKFDLLVQRLVDILQAFPGLIFIIFILSIVSVSRTSIILALGILFTAGTSRVVRSQAISVKQNDYVQAAKALGASDLRVLLRHVYPNVVAVVIIAISVQIGFVILIEASLSFLGFGVPPPFPSWGRMLQEAQRDMVRHPYLAIFPGLAITVTVYSLNMFGDALRDVLDPRLRGSR